MNQKQAGMHHSAPDLGHVIVLGAGAMGSLFGATLAQGGAAVTLVDVRADHIDAINAHGLKIQGYGGERTVRVRATDCTGELPRADIVLVQTKAMDTVVAVESIHRVFGPETVAVSFQNGLGNEEVIAGIVGHERVLAGLTAQGATRIGPGVVHNFGDLPTYVGEMEGGLSERAERIARGFTAAGLPTHASADIRRDMWKKLLGNVGLSPTSAVTNLTQTEIMSVPELREVVLAAVDEAAAVGAAEGVELDAEEAPLGAAEARRAVGRRDRSCQVERVYRHPEPAPNRGRLDQRLNRAPRREARRPDAGQPDPGRRGQGAGEAL